MLIEIQEQLSKPMSTFFLIEHIKATDILKLLFNVCDIRIDCLNHQFDGFKAFA
jgi:hypothetical protein